MLSQLPVYPLREGHIRLSVWKAGLGTLCLCSKCIICLRTLYDCPSNTLSSNPKIITFYNCTHTHTHTHTHLNNIKIEFEINRLTLLNTESLKGEEKQNCLVVKITGSFQHALFFISKVLGSMRDPESDYSKVAGISFIGVKLALALAFR